MSILNGVLDQPVSVVADFLGATTPLAAPATDTPVLAWTADYGSVLFEYRIDGYSAASIALIRVGTVATEDTGTTYGSWTQDFAAAATTGASHVTQTGIAVANATTVNGRLGTCLMTNASGKHKQFTLHGRTYAVQTQNDTSSAVASANFTTGAYGGSTGIIHCVRLNGGGANLLAGSYIAAYGLSAPAA